jgi:DMSO/TMAO reductase YedYZ molybdopterin-dependent catalytic subunit
MSQPISRRETLRRGLAATSLLALLPEGVMVAPDGAIAAEGSGAADDAGVTFTDIPQNFNPRNPKSSTQLLDIRKIDGPFTPTDQFFHVQHFEIPTIDGDAHRLRITGLVKQPAEFSLADLRAMRSTEVAVGYECSGNSPHAMQGLASCGRFTGVPLRNLLRHVGIGSQAREVVFFGADRGPQEVIFRTQTYHLDQQFGRSVTLENALKPEPLVAYALDGKPLRREQGFPMRLIMPGWYGVANVKWLAEIHLQEDRYLGNFQARWYRSVVGEGGSGADTDPQTQWVETEITRMRLKSVIANVSKKDGAYQILGFALNDGTPLASVEVQIDGGPWQKATLAPTHDRYAWKLFTYRWEGATPGDHTVVSRATDANGAVQPTAADLSRKKTFLQDNGQFPRKVRIG